MTVGAVQGDPNAADDLVAVIGLKIAQAHRER
jgi:hypothetical protein